MILAPQAWEAVRCWAVNTRRCALTLARYSVPRSFLSFTANHRVIFFRVFALLIVFFSLIASVLACFLACLLACLLFLFLVVMIVQFQNVVYVLVMDDRTGLYRPCLSSRFGNNSE